MEFNQKKFKNMILYAALTKENKARGESQIVKRLFFGDFLNYRETGESLTGAKYLAMEQGPTPRRFKSTLEEMREDGEIIIEQAAHETRIRALVRPNINSFHAQDLHRLSKVLDELDNTYNHEEAQGLDYKFTGWKAAIAEGRARSGVATIPYETVYVHYAEPTQEEVDEIQEALDRLEESKKEDSNGLVWHINFGPRYTCRDENNNEILQVHMDLATTRWRLSLPNGTSKICEGGVDQARRAALDHLERIGRPSPNDLSFIKG